MTNRTIAERKAALHKLIADLPDTPHPDVVAYIAEHGENATLLGLTKSTMPGVIILDSTKPTIKESTASMAEEAAFEFYKEAQEVAFKLDGILGVIQLGVFAAKEADKIAGECEKQGHDERMTRAVVSGHLASTWVPQMIDGMNEKAKIDAKAAAKAK